MLDRMPCINPRCRRTFKADDGASETICGKCFRGLPSDVIAEHRRYWREIRKWDRRILRTSDALKVMRMHEIRDRYSAMLNRHWDTEIKARFLAPEKPAGLDAFLEEMFNDGRKTELRSRKAALVDHDQEPWRDGFGHS